MCVGAGVAIPAMLGARTRDLDLVAEADPLPLARSSVLRWGGSYEVFE